MLAAALRAFSASATASLAAMADIDCVRREEPAERRSPVGVGTGEGDDEGEGECAPTPETERAEPPDE